MFWLNFAFIGVIVMVIVYGVRFLLRRAFKIKKSKKEFFSYNHINDLHRKVDWAMRIIIMIVNITLVGMILYENISISVVVFGLVVLIIGDRFVQAFFEWKYSDNPKEAILTLSDMLVMVLSVVIVSSMNLLNLNLI
ncbi:MULTISPECIES: DUF4181 domain-containing protein [unclassified Sutcliffiella]|uniref:DUF4181 domain-containing protein n=1 Tax=unclassified Sutcliffiella TaxID=2837532 RepID=UPI0030D155C9